MKKFIAILLTTFTAITGSIYSVSAGTFEPIVGTQGFTVPDYGYVYIGMSRDYAKEVLGEPQQANMEIQGEGYNDVYHINSSYGNLIIHYNNNSIAVGIYSEVENTAYGGYIVSGSETTVNNIPETFSKYDNGIYVIVDLETGGTYMHYSNGTTQYLYNSSGITKDSIKLGY